LTVGLHFYLLDFICRVGVLAFMCIKTTCSLSVLQDSRVRASLPMEVKLYSSDLISCQSMRINSFTYITMDMVSLEQHAFNSNCCCWLHTSVPYTVVVNSGS
jgi:hypothetical protein